MDIPLEWSNGVALISRGALAGQLLNRSMVVHGNVPSRAGGLSDNLLDGCVEVRCLVDRSGVQPCQVGSLPKQLAALNRAHMAVAPDADGGARNR